MYTNPIKFSTILPVLAVFVFILLNISSCGLFDKELKQDEHMANFRRQMGRVEDSLRSHKDRIKAYMTIIEHINTDESLITPRKKNLLLVECNILISNEFFDVENYNKAIDYTNVVISLEPTLAKGYYSRGCIYQIMGQDSLALKDYDIALGFNPDFVDVYYNRGIIHEDNGDYDLALADYNKAIKLNPSYIANVYNNRGNTYLAKLVVDKAIEDYDKVISIDSTNIKAYINRAGAFILQNKPEKALADCNKAIALDSSSVYAYNKRAVTYEASKMYDQALLDYQRILQLDPFNKQGTNTEAKAAIRRVRVLMKKK